MKKKWTVVVILMVLVGALVYSGGQGEGSAESIKLTHWSAYEENRDFYDYVVAEFRKVHPNIEVETETFAQSDMEKKLAVSIPTKTAADIQDQISLFSFPYAEKYFTEVPADVKKEVMQSINQTYLHDCYYGDRLLGVPYSFYSEVLFYNTDMFAEAGLSSKAPDTMDELVSYAQKLTKYDDDGNVSRSGLSMRLSGNPSGNVEKYLALGLFPEGADTLAPGKESGKWHNGFNNEGGYAALKLYIDLLYKYRVTDFNITQDADAFAKGKAAMLEREQWVVEYMNRLSPDTNYKAAILPKGSKRRATFAITRNMFVPDATPHKDAAWQFIGFFYQKQFMEKLTRDEGWVTTRKDIDFATLLKDMPQLIDAAAAPPDLEFVWQKRIKPENEIMTRMGEQISLIFRDASLLDNSAKIKGENQKLADMVDSILKDAGLYGE